ncbi:hypothetical protein Sjap_015420 [Stephania japonica]|uniref:Glycosyltransferase N-terminal domain-containing protein n=1 Tax=Stephania japonica TaxID=461633 RepID=A0AAP0IJ78_9MAGN
MDSSLDEVRVGETGIPHGAGDENSLLGEARGEATRISCGAGYGENPRGKDNPRPRLALLCGANFRPLPCPNGGKIAGNPHLAGEGPCKGRRFPAPLATLSKTLENVMEAPHVLVIPFPAQGHVKPLMELSHRLVKHGIKVTFLNSKFNHKRIVLAMSAKGDEEVGKISFAALPDGLGPEDDRSNQGKLGEALWNVMPKHLEEFIKKINNDSTETKIKHVIADWSVTWAIEVAAKMGIPIAAYWPASGAFISKLFHVPKFIEDRIIDDNGVPYSNQMIKLSPTMPPMNTDHFAWLCMGDNGTSKEIFNLILQVRESAKLVDFFFLNSFYELEPFVTELFPNILCIGPLGSSSRGNFWPEDSTCLSWLDQQPANSVIYVAFGSHTMLDKRRIEELALGLELSGQPFLWVVRPDITKGAAIEYPDGFIKRVASRGQIVGWAPQRDVLAHPSVACFLSHCGWNSTIEGLSMGIPFLCWPYFADQFLNESYICDVWKVGLKLKATENGLISRYEIKTKVAMLLGDEQIKANSMKLKEMAVKNVSHGGASSKNLEWFIEKLIMS